MEYAPKGNLEDDVRKRKEPENPYTDDELFNFLKQGVDVISYLLHMHSIHLLGIKP